MCKLLIVPSIKPGKEKLIKRLINVSSSVLTGRTDDDGFGYAGITNNGTIHGRKWTDPKEVSLSNNKTNKYLSNNKLNEFFDIVKQKTNNKDIGVTSTDKLFESTVGLLVHARRITIGTKSIENTHPFYDTDTNMAMIHNGTIRNHSELTKKESTCDSETILHQYIKHNIDIIPNNIHKLSEDLIGEYAVGLIGSYLDDKKTIPYIDIFKSNKPLSACYVDELETLVFCTSETILEEILTKAELTFNNCYDLFDGEFLRFNCLTGKLTDSHTFALSREFTPHNVYDSASYWNNKEYDQFKQSNKQINTTTKKDEYETIYDLTKDDLYLISQLDEDYESDDSVMDVLKTIMN